MPPSVITGMAGVAGDRVVGRRLRRCIAEPVTALYRRLPRCVAGPIRT